MRLAVELMAGALRDPALSEVLRDGLRQARARIGERLGEFHPSWSEARRTAQPPSSPRCWTGSCCTGYWTRRCPSTRRWPRSAI
jgi:hypothetical protein